MVTLSSMPVYGAYRESGEDWIGTVPAHWEVKSIKAVLNERIEKNDPIKTKDILSLCMYRGVIPYSEKGGSGNKAKEDLTAYRLAYPGDIVLNSMNVIAGSVGLSKYFGAVSPVYYMLRPRKDSDHVEFFNEIFQNEAFQKSLIGLGNGILIKKSESSGKLNTIRMKIPMIKLNKVLLPCPPENEQLKILNFLRIKSSQIDEAIAIKKKQIALLKERKQIIIQKAVTQGLNPDVPMKDSGVDWIGQIPEHWEVKKLRYLGGTQNGISAGAEYFGEGHPFVSYGDVYKNRQLPTAVDGLAKSSFSDQQSYSVLSGDVFFTRTSETTDEIGFAAICFIPIDKATFAGFLIRFRPTSDKLTKEFSKYYFNAPMMREYFVKEMNLVIRASLSQELLKNLLVVLPPVDEQANIFEYLEDMSEKIDASIDLQLEQIEKLKEYKTTLINSAVTGKIKVA